MSLEALIALSKIVRVNLTAHEVQTRIIGRYPAALAPKMRVQYLIPRLRKQRIYPFIQFNRFLRGMYFPWIAVVISKKFAWFLKRCPRIFTSAEIGKRLQLIPYQKASARREVKVVAAPNHLVFAHAK